jgi:hypothetical protein
MRVNFRIDGKKFLSKRKFISVYTKKYFSLYGNLPASIRKSTPSFVANFGNLKTVFLFI